MDRRTAEEASGGKRAPAAHVAPLLQAQVVTCAVAQVLCEDVPTLLQCVRAIPALAWYPPPSSTRVSCPTPFPLTPFPTRRFRQQWNILHPYVTCGADDLADLKASGAAPHPPPVTVTVT